MVLMQSQGSVIKILCDDKYPILLTNASYHIEQGPSVSSHFQIVKLRYASMQHQSENKWKYNEKSLN